MSASTVRTVDDVLSVVDSQLGDSASLSESRRLITELTRRNRELTDASIDEIESIRCILSPITHNVEVLVRLMAKTGAVLAGVQATSFFYPMCDWTDAPWDLFCHTDTADEFITGYVQSSNSEIVEQVSAENGMKVVHIRKSILGFESPANIRVFVSDSQPMESVLGLRNSYEQTVVSAVGAFCFWPKLMSRNLYRAFDFNPGTSLYPRGRTFYEMKLRAIKKTHLRKPMQAPDIMRVHDSKVERVMFKNIYNIERREYNSLQSAALNVVYAVFNSSTRSLGHTGNMK